MFRKKMTVPILQPRAGDENRIDRSQQLSLGIKKELRTVQVALTASLIFFSPHILVSYSDKMIWL